jgi:hypothetical protein
MAYKIYSGSKPNYSSTPMRGGYPRMRTMNKTATKSAFSLKTGKKGQYYNGYKIIAGALIDITVVPKSKGKTMTTNKDITIMCAIVKNTKAMTTTVTNAFYNEVKGIVTIPDFKLVCSAQKNYISVYGVKRR